jgi:hypothetical protein
MGFLDLLRGYVRLCRPRLGLSKGFIELYMMV